MEFELWHYGVSILIVGLVASCVPLAYIEIKPTLIAHKALRNQKKMREEMIRKAKFTRHRS